MSLSLLLHLRQIKQFSYHKCSRLKFLSIIFSRLSFTDVVFYLIIIYLILNQVHLLMVRIIIRIVTWLSTPITLIFYKFCIRIISLRVSMLGLLYSNPFGSYSFIHYWPLVLTVSSTPSFLIIPLTLPGIQSI